MAQAVQSTCINAEPTFCRSQVQTGLSLALLHPAPLARTDDVRRRESRTTATGAFERRGMDRYDGSTTAERRRKNTPVVHARAGSGPYEAVWAGAWRIMKVIRSSLRGLACRTRPAFGRVLGCGVGRIPVVPLSRVRRRRWRILMRRRRRRFRSGWSPAGPLFLRVPGVAGSPGSPFPRPPTKRSRQA